MKKLLPLFIACFMVFFSSSQAQSLEQFKEDSKNALKFFDKQAYAEAIPYFEKAFVYSESLALKTNNTAQYRRRWADCWESLGKIKEAEVQYKFALRDTEAESGKEDEKYAEMLRRFGNFYARQKQYDLANKYLEEAITIFKKKNPQSFYLALAIRKKAEVAWWQKDNKKAQNLSVEALEVIKKISPLDTMHIEVFEQNTQNFKDKNYQIPMFAYDNKFSEKTRYRLRKAFGMFKQKKIAEASLYFEANLYGLIRFFEKKPENITSSIALIKLSYDYAAELDKLNNVEKEIKIIQEKEAFTQKLYQELLAASQAYAIGDYQKAIPLFEKALPNSKTYFEGKDRDYATVLGMLGVAYQKQSMLDKAEKTFLEAEKLLKNTEYTEDYAGIVKGLALVYQSQGKYAVAEKYLLESIELYKKNGGKKDKGYIAAISTLGVIYEETDRQYKAEKIFLEAKDLALSLDNGEETERYASVLSNLAYLYTKQGKYLLAEEYFKTCTNIYEKLVGKEHPEYAKSLYSLAYLYHGMGFFEEAEYFYLEAKKIDKQKLGEFHPQYLQTMTALANLYRDMANVDKALQYYQETLELYTKTDNYWYNKDLASLASSLGYLFMYVKDFKSSQKMFDTAKKIYVNLYGKNSSDYAKELNNEAVLLMEQNKFAEAETKITEAISIEKKLPAISENYEVIEENLARCYAQQNNKLAQAYQIYKKILKKKTDFITKTFPALSEREKEEFYETNRDFFLHFQSLLINYYPQNKSLAGDLFDLQIATKALLLSNSSQIRQRIMLSGDKDLQNMYQDWRDKKNFLNKVYLMSNEDKQKANLNEKDLEKEINDIERLLSQKSQDFAKEYQQKQYSWKDIQKKIKANEAVIEIVRTLKIDKNKIDTVYVALVLKNNSSQPDWVLLENGTELENAAVAYYNNSIRARKQDKYSYKLFWEAIQSKLQGINRVYFSPDGIYNQININALWNPASQKYLIDELQVQLISNSKDLMFVSKGKNKNKNGVLFGFPNYELNFQQTKSVGSQRKTDTDELKKSKQRFFENGEISPLPGTKTEVENISRILSDKQITLQKFMENEATEDALKKIESPRILHIATHGFFMENTEEQSGVAKKKQNPLFRSGLLLAGAKNAFEKKYNAKGEDGILTAYEAMTLHLYQTDLVVASACETGLGDIKNGEGVYGLQRAFRIAGAKNILMSLWKVDDTATQELMTIFYEKWIVSDDALQAFREAQVAIKVKYPDPYYWAAFVMIGE
ncbi:MAG: CHAT domain-containing protein [Thermonemataceae bacterium]|nr:CHAT domain-containing protein [Thermonemataceae bacterium]